MWQKILSRLGSKVGKRIYEPYSFKKYEYLLTILKRNPIVNFAFFDQKEEINDKINVIVRYDIDTLMCTKRIPLFISLHKKLNIPCAIFFRVDGRAYWLIEQQNILNSIKEDPLFDIGLHSVCYVEDSFELAFAIETQRFIEQTGIKPKSFTVHGLGHYKQKTRSELYKKANEIGQSNGFLFTDCIQENRIYNSIVEDCHWDSNYNRRFIYKDQFSAEYFTGKSKNVFHLILVHPCYWF